jgi:cytosol alanyl aminopeptidase
MLPAMRLALRCVALSLVTACGSSEPRPAAVERAPRPSRPTPPALQLDGSVVPREVALDLSLDPGKADFSGTAVIAAEVKRPTRLIWMHGKRLQVTRATVSLGGEQTAQVSSHGEFLALALPRPVGPGAASIRLEYNGQVVDGDTEGLFRQSEGGNTYLYTQFEPTGARLAFPGFDEPIYKVPWQVTLRVPRGLVALSNTPVASQSTDGDMQVLVFAKTRPMPSYLVAVAVGPFDLVDLGKAGRNGVPMRIAVPKGRAAEARYAGAVTGQILEALEAYFDIPFPYEKLDSVAIPTFLGAMENPGLVTYSAPLLLAKPNEESVAFQQGYAGICAHELAHHWFGDLVTMAWWDDIWLNESFATFMADRVVDDWQKSWGIAVGRVKDAQRAFHTDALMSARKVHNPIRQHNDIVAAFDAISYAKGGALLDMFEAWMGRPSFQRAIHSYLTAHAWGNAASKDFIAALAAESKPEVATAFEGFIEQGGIPLVSLSLLCEAGTRPMLVLGQERFLPIGSKGSADQTWSVPMCVGFPRNKQTAVQCFLLSGRTQLVPLDAETCPAWIDGNAGGHGYYRVAYAGDLGQKLLEEGTLDTAGRSAALYNLKAMVEAGRRPMADLLAAIPVAARDRDPEIVGVAVELASEMDPLVTDALQPNYTRFLAASFARPARALGWRPRRGESTQDSRLRGNLLDVAALRGEDPALLASARTLARRYLSDPTSAEPRLAAAALAAVARSGTDPTLFDRMEAAFRKSDDRRFRSALLSGMVMSRDPTQRDRTIALMASSSLTLEELAVLTETAMAHPSTRGPTWDFVVGHLDEVMARLPFLVRPAVVQFAAFFCDAEHRTAVDTVFRAKLADVPGGAKYLAETLEVLDLCIARRAKYGAEVSAFLTKQ